LLEREVLAEATHAAVLPAREPAPRPAPVEARSKSGAAIVERNMFCTDCTPAAAAEDKESDNNRTQLPLRLIATNIALQAEHSFASVLNTSDQRQGGYSVGQEIPDAGIVVSIGQDYLTFHNSKNDRNERIVFEGANARVIAPSRAASASAGSSSLAEEYVRVIDSTHYEVDRKLIDKLKGNPLLGGAKARPVVKDGKMNGVRLYALRSTGLAHAMGLRNGDTLLAANGVKLKSYEAGLELMGQLQSRDHWSVDIERRGKPVTLTVDLQ
jgi:type II secretion system protein C